MTDVLSPRIYVGAGGSGRRLVALLKKAVLEDTSLSAEEKQAFQFLAIDADEYQEDCRPLDRHLEYLHVAGFRPSLARNADFLKEPVADWWFDSYTPPYVQQGAGAVRLIGRLCLFYHYPHVRDAIVQAIQRATTYSAGRQVSGEVAVYVICSLAGGTGSSMLMDLGFIARQNCSQRQVYVNAVLLLPDVFTVTQVLTQQKFKDRWMANGYAALKELVYFNEHPQEFMPLYRPEAGREQPVGHPHLFDQCLFIEPVLGNSSTVANDQDIFSLAAQSLYLFSASAGGSASGSVLVNTPGVHYASIGMQSLVFPHRHLQEYAGLQSTARFLREAVVVEATPDQQRQAQEQVKGDLQAERIHRAQELTAGFLQELPPIEMVDIDPEADAVGAVQRAKDRYRSQARLRQEQLEAWVKATGQEVARRMDARIAAYVSEGRSLGWVQAYLKALEGALAQQAGTLEQQARNLQMQEKREEDRCKPSPPPRWWDRFTRREHDGDEIEDLLYQVYADLVPQRLAAQAAHELIRAVASQWLQPRLTRLSQLSASTMEAEIRRREEQAEQVARSLDEKAESTPHTSFTITGQDLERLVKASTDTVDLGAAPMEAIWRWITQLGTLEGLPALTRELEEQVCARYASVLDMPLLDSWERITPLAELKERFVQAALNCRPFWSYVQEQAREHLTRVSVVALPQGSKWTQWVKDLRMELRPIPGDPRRVVFLTVEGCMHLNQVHLKELPQWFRAYQQVQRAYEWGRDPRPLHIHKLWQALPDVDGTLVSSPERLFGPLRVRGWIQQEGRTYVLALPEFAELRRVVLGNKLDEAILALGSLPDEAVRHLWAYVREHEERILKKPWDEIAAPYEAFLAELGERERLDGPDLALQRQTRIYLDELLQKKRGLAPGSDLAGPSWN